MKWIGITGSWRQTPSKLKSELKREVLKAIKNGDGIVTGGALGVDYLATNLVIKNDRNLSRLKVFLPTSLNIYINHYKKRAQQGVISQRQAISLINQLETVKASNPDSLIEDFNNIKVNQTSYFNRNKKVVDNSKELIAFHVNNSPGTQNTIEYAKKSSKPVKVFIYKVSLTGKYANK